MKSPKKTQKSGSGDAKKAFDKIVAENSTESKIEALEEQLKSLKQIMKSEFENKALV